MAALSIGVHMGEGDGTVPLTAATWLGRRFVEYTLALKNECWRFG